MNDQLILIHFTESEICFVSRTSATEHAFLFNWSHVHFHQRLSNLLLHNLTTKCWPFSVEYLERCVDQWAPSCWGITVKCRRGGRKPWPTIYDLFQSVAQDAWQLPMLTLGATMVTRGSVERSRTERLKDDKKEKTLIRGQHKESEIHLERKRNGILKVA